MISYPGEILARFGRYEGTASLGRQGSADLWKAWDPYLERFVLVVVLADLDQAELIAAGGEVETFIDTCVGDKIARRRIFDFAPPTARTPAHFVLEWTAARRPPGPQNRPSARS